VRTYAPLRFAGLTAFLTKVCRVPDFCKKVPVFPPNFTSFQATSHQFLKGWVAQQQSDVAWQRISAHFENFQSARLILVSEFIGILHKLFQGYWLRVCSIP
jgi:hypothetical protein